jgi:hypothetical protein
VAERWLREPLRSAPQGAGRIRVGRFVPASSTPVANDNRVPVLVWLRRALYWLLVAIAAIWFVQSNF